MPTKLSDQISIEKILQEMTLEEKARLVTGGSPFRSEAMPKYGIPAVFMLDSCGGINSLELGGEYCYQKTATEAEAAGSPIDRETLREMGGLLIGMADTETQNFTRNGTMFCLTNTTRASATAGRKDELFEALREAGYGDLVYETVNANSLSAFVKEQTTENGDALPQWLAGLVTVFEKTTVGVRKTAR